MSDTWNVYFSKSQIGNWKLIRKQCKPRRWNLLNPVLLSCLWKCWIRIIFKWKREWTDRSSGFQLLMLSHNFSWFLISFNQTRIYNEFSKLETSILPPFLCVFSLQKRTIEWNKLAMLTDTDGKDCSISTNDGWARINNAQIWALYRQNSIIKEKKY